MWPVLAHGPLRQIVSIWHQRIFIQIGYFISISHIASYVDAFPFPELISRHRSASFHRHHQRCLSPVPPSLVRLYPSPALPGRRRGGRCATECRRAGGGGQCGGQCCAPPPAVGSVGSHLPTEPHWSHHPAGCADSDTAEREDSETPAIADTSLRGEWNEGRGATLIAIGWRIRPGDEFVLLCFLGGGGRLTFLSFILCPPSRRYVMHSSKSAAQRASWLASVINIGYANTRRHVNDTPTVVLEN